MPKCRLYAMRAPLPVIWKTAAFDKRMGSLTFCWTNSRKISIISKEIQILSDWFINLVFHNCKYPGELKYFMLFACVTVVLSQETLWSWWLLLLKFVWLQVIFFAGIVFCFKNAIRWLLQTFEMSLKRWTLVDRRIFLR